MYIFACAEEPRVPGKRPRGAPALCYPAAPGIALLGSLGHPTFFLLVLGSPYPLIFDHDSVTLFVKQG